MAESSEKDSRTRDLERIVRARAGFTPSRLTLAREIEGLSITDLAARIEATSSAISQFENGTTKPKVETLIRLSLALGVPPAFFSAEPLPPIAESHCHFRSLRSATAKERRRVLANGTLLKRVVDYVSEMVNFPPNQLSALQEFWRTVRDVEALATAVRDAWNLGQGPISSMVGLLESMGIIPIEVPGHSARLDAFSVSVEGLPMVFFTVEKGSASRRRFDAGHELGHLIMHGECTPGDEHAEKEADAFASALLLPATPFISECPRRLDWDALRAVKRRWGVSLAAIVRRAKDLGIFSDATYRRAYSQLNQKGWRTAEPDEPAMERPSLLPRALALLENAGIPFRRMASDLCLNEATLEKLLAPSGPTQLPLGFT
jgi:Zn-dependent peptidase ImmA (M78 family)/transcriptional regulator with XRE-family HTH domain